MYKRYQLLGVSTSWNPKGLSKPVNGKHLRLLRLFNVHIIPSIHLQVVLNKDKRAKSLLDIYFHFFRVFILPYPKKTKRTVPVFKKANFLLLEITDKLIITYPKFFSSNY